MRLMKKLLKWTVIVLIIGLGALVGLERLAAEREEVVELLAMDEQGKTQITRLWVVDHEGSAYLRVGAEGSGWYDRIQINDTIALVRGGERQEYEVRSRPEKSDRINELMQQKYTWGDSLIAAMVGSREGSIPLELIPVP